MRRPKADESDEDLLKLQQDFLASKHQPAARVVKNVGKTRSSEVPSCTPEVQLSQQQQQQQQIGGSVPTTNTSPTKRDVVHMETFSSQSSSTKLAHIPPTKKLKAEQKSR